MGKRERWTVLELACDRCNRLVGKLAIRNTSNAIINKAIERAELACAECLEDVEQPDEGESHASQEG